MIHFSERAGADVGFEAPGMNGNLRGAQLDAPPPTCGKELYYLGQSFR